MTLLMEATEVSEETHWPAAIHWQTLSHNVASSTPDPELEPNSNVSGDRHWFKIQLQYDHDYDSPNYYKGKQTGVNT